MEKSLGASAYRYAVFYSFKVMVPGFLARMYVGFARPTKGMNFGNTLD